MFIAFFCNRARYSGLAEFVCEESAKQDGIRAARAFGDFPFPLAALAPPGKILAPRGTWPPFMLLNDSRRKERCGLGTHRSPRSCGVSSRAEVLAASSRSDLGSLLLDRGEF